MPALPLPRILRAALLFAAVGTLAYHAVMELSTVGLEEPIGYPEIVYKRLAEVWPHQYQQGHFVDAQDNYGPGYTTFCRPFLALVSDPYAAARVANFAALALASAILLLLLRNRRFSWTRCLAITAIFFALNAGSSSLQARPDFLGTLCIVVMLALGTPQARRRLPLVAWALLSGLCGAAAFLTKPYCALAWGAAVSFALLDSLGGPSWRRELAAVSLSTAVFCAALAGFAAANPYFILETVRFHYSQADPSLATLGLQLRDYGVLACGLVAATALGMGRMGATRGCWPEDRDRRYWNWALFLGVFVILGALGWHRGAYLTYFHHLVLPALAVCAAYACDVLPFAWECLLLCANCAVLVALAPPLPQADAGWQALARDVRSQPGPVVLDYMLEPLSRGRPDARVAGNGIIRFALDLPAHAGGDVNIARQAQAEVDAYVEAERLQARNREAPRALYVDCYLFKAHEDDPRVSKGGFLAVPRNEHPLAFTCYGLENYAAVQVFVIHPFYGSQNCARQDAGKWISSIIKFERLPVKASARLPITLVDPRNGVP